jgi:hypothetical protein
MIGEGLVNDDGGGCAFVLILVVPGGAGLE